MLFTSSIHYHYLYQYILECVCVCEWNFHLLVDINIFNIQLIIQDIIKCSMYKFTHNVNVLEGM